MRNAALQSTSAAAPARDFPAIGAHKQYATFTVGDLFFGIEVLHTQELLRNQEITRVPLARPEVEGLINLRGQIVTALDMRRLLGLEPRASGQSAMVIVVRVDDSAVSLVVDEIGDVISLGGDRHRSAPPTISARQKELIRCVCELDDRLLLVLDTESVLKGAPRPPM